MKLKDLPVGEWFLFHALLHRKVTDTLSCLMHPDGTLNGPTFAHNLDLTVETSEDITASLIHPRARYREFVNAENGYTIETNGDWNHPRGVLDARRPETEAEDEPGSTFTAKTGQRFMDTKSGCRFQAVLVDLPSPFCPRNPDATRLEAPIPEPTPKKPLSKPLKLVRSAQKQADIDMALRTHTGGEPDIVLQGRSLNGKGEIVISRLFSPAFPEKPALDFKIEGITLDECRALRDYFDSMAADIQETRV